MKNFFSSEQRAQVLRVFADASVMRKLLASNEGDRLLSEYQWRELIDTRHELQRAYDGLIDKVNGANTGKMSDDEKNAEQSVLHMTERLTSEIDFRDQIGNRGPRRLSSGAPAMEDAPAARREGVWFRDQLTGRELRGVTHQESLRVALPNLAQPRGRIGELIASVVRGRPVSPELEQDFRAMSIGTLSAGGYAVPEPFSLMFFDLARAASVVMKAGAITVPMIGATLRIAKMTGDPTVAWKSENNAFSASDSTLGAIDLTARTVGILISGSEELFMDSPNIAEAIEKQVREKMSLEMDRVALVGSGVAPEPGGIMKSGITANTDVQTRVVGGTPLSYDFFSRMVQDVRTANHEPNAAVWHPRDLGTLDRLKDTTNQPMVAPRSYTDLQHFATTSIPINLESGASPNDASIAIVGKWDELIIAPRMDVMLLFSRVSHDGSGSAFAKFQIQVRAVARMDVGIARGAAFCVGTGIDN